MLTPVNEPELRSGKDLLDGAPDEDLARLRSGGHARGNVYGKASRASTSHLDLADVHTGPNGDAHFLQPGIRVSLPSAMTGIMPAGYLSPLPSIGRRTRTTVSPGREEIVMCPWCCSSTIRREMSSPRPVPFPTSFVVKKGSKAWA